MTSKSKGKISALPTRRPAPMSPRERVTAALWGDPVDRIPVCFWHHFQPEGSGRALAYATTEFFDDRYNLDILKIMPDIPYPFPHKSIRTVDDWRLIEPIDASRSRFVSQRAEAVRVLREMHDDLFPIVVTVFNPLSEMLHFAESRELFIRHLDEAPVVIHEAMAVVAENIRTCLQASIDAGADGAFYALQGCSAEVMPASTYREFGRPYDLMALSGAANGWLNILHVHGNRDLYFREVLDYPVQVLSWSDRQAGPSLREARTLTNKCLMGGWNEFGPLSNGPTEAIEAEAADAIAQTNATKFILAGGCSVPDDTDPIWLSAAREIAENLTLP